MPNICTNEISIYSRDERPLKAFMDFVKSEDSDFDFNKIVPSPDWDNTPNEDGELAILDNEAPAGMGFKKFPTSGKSDSRWYDWNCEHWGTKWNSFDGHMEFDELYGEELKYTFDTAWSPPAPILMALKEKFPDLSIHWFYRVETWEACGFLHEEI